MPRSVKLVLGLGFLAGIAAGCSSPHSIKPGIWSLKIKPAEEYGLGSKFARPAPRDVEVQVSWSKEEKGIELVRVQYNSRDGSRPVQRVLAGDIRDGLVTLDGNDQTWRLILKGRVLSPESMTGSAFGRVIYDKDTYFSGLWSMDYSGEARE
jgi:hypothetical protein